MPTDQILAMVRSRSDLAKRAGIRLDPTKHVRRNPATATGRYQIPTTIAFSSFVIFLCKSSAENYFQENYFFVKNILRQKLFSVETERT
jgi:hypothetical protein